MSYRTDQKKRQKKQQRVGLYKRQKGKCFYCKDQMILIMKDLKHGSKSNPKMATFEHLDDKFSNERGNHNGEFRIVLACLECNNKQGRFNQANQSIEELRRRSGR